MPKKYLILISVIIVLSSFFIGCFPDYSSSTNPYYVRTYDTSTASSPIYVHVIGLTSDNMTLQNDGSVYEGAPTDITGIVVCNGSTVGYVIKPSGDIVGTTESQELTNKVISSPEMNGIIDIGSEYLIFLSDTSARGIELKNDSNDAYGSRLYFVHDSESPAVGDRVGEIEFDGNSEGGSTHYGEIYCRIQDKGNGTEQGMYKFWLSHEGSLNNAMNLDGDGQLWIDGSLNADDNIYLGGHIYSGAYVYIDDYIIVNSPEDQGVTVTVDGRPAINLLSIKLPSSGARYVGDVYSKAYNTNNDTITYGLIRTRLNDDTAGSEDSDFYFLGQDSGSLNIAMILTGAGVLSVDDSYGTFDELDDAEILRQGISNGDKELLLANDILTPKINSSGDIIKNEYMINLQPLLKLMSGGIYQNRDYIESLEERIKILEGKIN